MKFSVLSIFSTIIACCNAGPLSAIASYGVCQTGCNTLVVACYAASGFTFGVATAGAAVPAAIVGCNTGLGLCMASCWAVTGAAIVTPTP